jgi:phosphatidylserine/phosphatidylglycerophosphate/cardiolipin synthase-like enzyme
MMQPALAQRIHQLVADMPHELVVGLVSALESGENGRWAQLQTKVAQAINQPGVRQKALLFLHDWQEEYPQTTIEAVTLAMLTAAQVAKYYRQTQQLEIVWTGPDSQVIPLRRNDQALLQLIHEAQQSLHIVSFAVYKVANIAQAIIEAANRGVSISIYLETPDESEGKMSFDTVKALGEDVVKRVKLYVWPREKRPLSEDGKFGSLHAKIALADDHTLLISSANLTDYALSLNMEMGLLVRGGKTPQQVAQHLQRLVEQSIFQRVS